MIFDAMKLIRDSLQQYIVDVEQADPNQSVVILENIAMAQELGGNADNQSNQVVMTLVNLQEEVTLKNSSGQRLENGRTVYRKPPTFLNLFILFSILNEKQYETALKRLSRVIEFFQWKKEIFLTTTVNNLPQEVKISMDLFSLTFEQQNYLWGSLGGKQVPFVLYRAGLVTIESGKIQAEGQPITEIQINTNRLTVDIS